LINEILFLTQSVKTKSTDNKVMYWAVIPAAGVGKRMGGDLPKQYLSTAGKTILEHSLDGLLGCSEIGGAVVAISAGDDNWAYLKYQNEKPILIAEGGKERCDSVLSALHELSKIADDDVWVLVHDAARPCIRQEDVQKLIQSCKKHSVGGILAIPVKDTIKKSNDPADADLSEACLPEIRKTVDRTRLWYAQTPQMFRLGVLRDALTKALDAGAIITDEASAIEWSGGKPLLIEGHADNIKITCQEDMLLVSMYFQ
jgi:2-C-methyl-D-erythritol 4-phosphate cytidylyltransferase